MKRIHALIFSVLLFLTGSGLLAQVNNTLYHMHGIPQSNRVNPAFRPAENFYLGFPLLSPLRLKASSSSLAYGDLIYPHPTEDSLITFMHPDGSKEAFLAELKARNFVNGGLGSSLFSMGFQTGAGFFSLDLVSRVDGTVYYPGDLARLVLRGAGESSLYTLDGIGSDISEYQEVSVGWSRDLIDGLRIGARIKVLFGTANLSTTASRLDVRTAQEVWNIRSEMQFNASLPFAEVIYGEDGMIEDILVDEALEDPGFNVISSYMFNTRNLGAGIDLGVDWEPLEDLRLSLSLLDLGFIRWKDEVHYAQYEMEYDYEGLELNPFDLSEEYTFNDYLDSTLSQMIDSLSGFLVTAPGGAYSKRTNTKLYAGVSYHVTPKISFGLLSRTDFLNGKITEQLTASANLSTGRFLNLSLSYSYLNAYFKNIGAGLSIHAGPFNFYMVSDNALNALFWPHEARSANLWIGLNLMFGYREKADLPLVF